MAAFVTETGLDLLEERVMAALRRGAQLPIVTGDYLAFNQVDALRRLLGWSQVQVRGDVGPVEGGAPGGGQLRVRVVETALADGGERAFHPKSWLFEAPEFGVAFVGSSNLSAWMPPLARRPAAGRRAVPSLRVLAAPTSSVH